MKVKCISEKVSIENKVLYEWSKNSELELTEGKIYVVFAISKYSNSLFFYVLGDESDDYPLAFPAELFEIIDGNVSKYWDTQISQITTLSEIEIINNQIISFKEWNLKRDQFYENVLDELEPEITIFKDYRDKIFKE